MVEHLVVFSVKTEESSVSFDSQNDTLHDNQVESHVVNCHSKLSVIAVWLVVE